MAAHAARRQAAGCARRRRRLDRRRGGRDAGAGGRVGLRQVHGRPRAGAAGAPDGGHIRFEGAELTASSDQDFNKVRPHLQMVFQDPAASLNPRLSVRRMVEEPLKLHTRA